MHPKIDKKKNILLIIILLFVLSSTHNSNLNFDFLKIDEIQVSGTDTKLNEFVKKDLSYLYGKNILFIDKKKILSKVKKHNFIKNLRVNKIFPKKLILNLELSDFVAYIEKDEKIFLINEFGTLVEERLIEEKFDLPKFYGEIKSEYFIKFKKLLIENGFHFKSIDEIHFLPSNRWDLKLKNGILIKLPNVGYEKSIVIAKQLIKELENKKNYSIDLRIADNIVISDV